MHGRCTVHRGDIFKTFRVRASAHEVDLADAQTFLIRGKVHWQCGRCDAVCAVDHIWHHIFFFCKHRENFDVADNNEPVLSCDEADNELSFFRLES